MYSIKQDKLGNLKGQSHVIFELMFFFKHLLLVPLEISPKIVTYNKTLTKNQHYLIKFTQFGQMWGVKQSHHIFAHVVLYICAGV